MALINFPAGPPLSRGRESDKIGPFLGGKTVDIRAVLT